MGGAALGLGEVRKAFDGHPALADGAMVRLPAEESETPAVAAKPNGEEAEGVSVQ